MKFSFSIILVLCFSVVCFSQSKIAFQCRSTNSIGSVSISGSGDIYQKPCTNRSIFVQNLNNSFKLQDINYIPFAGSLDADILFSNASNDNVQNNAGLITTSNHFVGMANDLKITATGANKWHIGLLNQIRSGGGFTGNGQLIGFYNFVTNRGNLTATPYVQGIYSSVNLEGNATEAVGADISVFRGSAVNNTLFVGGRFTAANGYVAATNVFGVQAIVRTVSSGAIITNGYPLFAQFNNIAGHTITNGYGLFVGNWTNNGTIQNSAAIKIDNTTNAGSVTTFAIASDSTAESYFTGNLSINGSGKFFISSSETPLPASDCTKGQITYDDNFIYICSQTNTWKKSALAAL